MIVEVTDIGFEARPDLIGVVETALDDAPSDATQIMRAFVAGFRGYNDCPQTDQGNPLLSSIITVLLERSISIKDIFWNDWFKNTPWTAVMAAPLEQPSIGAIPPLPANQCDP